MLRKLFLFVFLGCTVSVLPPFIKPCSRSCPWLQFCIMQQIPRVVRALKAGYPPMGLQSIDPFVIEQMEVPIQPDFRLWIRNFQLRGLSKAKFEFIMVDPFRNLMEARVRFPQINIQGFYNMQGKMFLEYVDTQGPAAITFMDVVIEVKIQFKVVQRSDGVYYEMPIRPIPGRDMDLQITKANLYFGNLIPNDPDATDEMNNLIRHSFFPLFDSIKPGVISVMWQVMYVITAPLLAQTTTNELFTD